MKTNHNVSFCSFADIVKRKKSGVYANSNQEPNANIEKLINMNFKVVVNRQINTDQSPINAHVGLVNTDQMCMKRVSETPVVNNGFKNTGNRGCFSPVENNNVYSRKNDKENTVFTITCQCWCYR